VGFDRAQAGSTSLYEVLSAALMRNVRIANVGDGTYTRATAVRTRQRGTPGEQTFPDCRAR
jgi:hypothetical protein